jgi:hypothetical protein
VYSEPHKKRFFTDTSVCCVIELLYHLDDSAGSVHVCPLLGETLRGLSRSKPEKMKYMFDVNLLGSF